MGVAGGGGEALVLQTIITLTHADTPHTGIPPSKQQHRSRRKQRAQIKASRPACAAAAQKGVKSSVRRKQERWERGMMVLSSVFPSHSLRRSLDGSSSLYPQSSGPSGRCAGAAQKPRLSDKRILIWRCLHQPEIKLYSSTHERKRRKLLCTENSLSFHQPFFFFYVWKTRNELRLISSSIKFDGCKYLTNSNEIFIFILTFHQVWCCRCLLVCNVLPGQWMQHIHHHVFNPSKPVKKSYFMPV